jgi:integrase
MMAKKKQVEKKVRQKVRLIQKTVGRTTANGKKIQQKTSTWYLDYGHGNLRSTGITDWAVAEQLRAREEAKLILSSHGLPDPSDFKRSLADHIKDYEAKLIAPGRDNDYVKQTLAHIRKIVKACGWRTAVSIKASDVNDFAVGLHEKDYSSRTVHSHLTSIKGFTRWLVAEGKLPADPLAGVRKPSPKRETSRRMLLPEEWRALRRTSLAEGVERYGMDAAARIRLYAVAIQTGLRNGECRSLTRANLFLDGPEPYITCSGSVTKNKKPAQQYIKPELAAELRASLNGHGQVFPDMPNTGHTAPMLLADLAAARAAWVKDNPDEGAGDFLLPTNHAGEVLDFHALRHTCGAWLALAGVHPKVIQAVMRHSTITLTMDAYGHLFPGQAADAIKKLPDMLL